MQKKRFVKAIILTLIICFSIGIGAFPAGPKLGAIIPNASATGTYPVQGVDVSPTREKSTGQFWPTKISSSLYQGNRRQQRCGSLLPNELSGGEGY